jgi:hypothetical protein
LSAKTPESVTRIRDVKRPSTVVMEPLAINHTTPNQGRIAKTTEMMSSIGSDERSH